jgi:iron complex transport system substrate-binding protein
MFRIARGLAVLGLALSLSLTHAAAQPAASFSLVDALGRRVAFDRPPTRIVLTGKAVVMVADAAYLFPEASARIVALGNTAQGGRSFVADYDPAFASKAALDNQAGPEQVAAARPDAVLLKSSLAGGLGKAIESLGIPVVYVDFETPEQYERDLAVLGALFRDEARSRELVALFKGRQERIARALAGLDEAEKPRVLMLYYADQGGAASFNVPPLGWIQATLVAAGGGRIAWKDAKLGQGWTKVSFEQVAAWDPDEIFVIAYATDAAAVVDRLKADTQWAALRAAKSGSVFAFPGDYYSWDQPDSRWPLGLAWAAKRIQPERLAGLDLRAEVRAFYKDFYGMGDAAYGRLVAPKLPAELR